MTPHIEIIRIKTRRVLIFESTIMEDGNTIVRTSDVYEYIGTDKFSDLDLNSWKAKLTSSNKFKYIMGYGHCMWGIDFDEFVKYVLSQHKFKFYKNETKWRTK